MKPKTSPRPGRILRWSIWFSLGFVLVVALVVLWAGPFNPRTKIANGGEGKNGGQGENESNNKMTLEMPDKSFTDPLPELSDAQSKLSDALKADVTKLAGEIGERNLTKYPKLMEAAAFIEKSLTTAGHNVEQQKYDVRGRTCFNLAVEIVGKKQPDEIVVIGAHYDSVPDGPGANDNGSGVAGMLALARAIVGKMPDRTVRFVAFANEEAPYFQTESMGSLVYAKRCRDRKENIVAMLSLETIGYYSDVKDSQKYPFPFNQYYPSTGNFIGFIGNTESAELVKQVAATFRQHAKFPSEGGAIPGSIKGVGWSDHSSFWECGYKGLMVTDTALFRYPHYHKAEDTPDKIDYGRLARVIEGLEKVVDDLARVKGE